MKRATVSRVTLSKAAEKKLSRVPADVQKRFRQFVDAIKTANDELLRSRFDDHKLTAGQYPDGHRDVHIKGKAWTARYSYESTDDGEIYVVVWCFGTHQECI